MRNPIGYCLIWICFGCLEPYDPPVTKEEINFLVVDGFLNSASGTGTVKLTRAVALSGVGFPSEQNANVMVEDENGGQLILTESGTGNYEITGALFNESLKYRLLVTTADGKSYASEYIRLLPSPEIDSVNWTSDPDGIEIKVTTHSAPGEVQYYRWEYEETWLYTAPFPSSFSYANGIATYRPPEEQIFECFHTRPSTVILVGETERLTENVISNFHLTTLEKGSVKTRHKYSILVKQQSLSKEALDFWRDLQEITEGLGGLFDPLPGAEYGNIYSVNDPGEQVLGYFSGGRITEKRIFIAYEDLPGYLRVRPDISDCEEFRIDIQDLQTLGPTSLLTSQITEGITVVGYYFTGYDCADCRVQGGSTSKPPFWP